MGARFAALQDDVGEINLNLTALIASLGKTEDVDAARAGEITGSAPDSDTATHPP